MAFSPYSKLLATGGEDYSVRLWEVESGQERLRLAGHAGPVSALAFLPDGKTLASAGADTTIMFWDLTGHSLTGQRAVVKLTPGDRLRLWNDLAGSDGANIHRAIAALRDDGSASVLFLGERLRPAKPLDPRELKQLFAELNHDQPAVRDKATKALLDLGKPAEPALREFLESFPPFEVRRRLEEILLKLGPSSPANTRDRLRELRAVEVLEHIGCPESRKVLQVLASGGPTARLTLEARAALERLDRQARVDPKRP
jgi:hypothetical protein